MGAVVIPLIVILVLAVVVVMGLRAWASRREHLATELAEPDSPTLDYAVPAEQDPVVLLTALTQEGYPASTDPHDTRIIHVSCPAGPDRDRARVRAVIASVHTTGIASAAPFEADDVRFRDER